MTDDPHAGRPSGPHPAEPEPSLTGYPPPAPWSRPPAPWSQQPTDGQPQPYGAQDVWPGEYAPAPAADGQVGSYPQPPAYGPPPGALPVPAWAVVKPSPMPDSPREYQQMLRGPRYRWWRPLLSLLLAAAIAIPLMVLAFFPVVLIGWISGVSRPFQWAARAVVQVDNLGPGGFLYVNLSLVVLIPTAGLSIWIAHRIRPRYVASVRGRIRWSWLLRCLAVVVPVWVVYLGASALLEPATSPRPAQWGLLLVIVVFLTPLQAAGEEYFFRGWIMQNVGSWFRRPVVGLVAGLVVSVCAFSAAHGSPDVWVLGSLAVFALTAGLATWRTGGLEAGIAIHAVNNIGVFFTVILLGGWQEAFVSASSKGAPVDVLVALVVHAVALALILWQAKKAGIERRYQPTPSPATAQSTLPAPAYPGYAQPLAGQ